MSSNLSLVSDSKSTNRNKTVVCAYCGKKETGNYDRHFKNHHTGLQKRQPWIEGQDLLGEPWCRNWKQALTGVEATDTHPLFKKAYERANNLRAKRSISEGASVSQSDVESHYSDRQFMPEEGGQGMPASEDYQMADNKVQKSAANQGQEIAATSIEEEKQQVKPKEFAVPYSLQYQQYKLSSLSVQVKNAPNTILGKRNDRIDQPSDGELEASCAKVRLMLSRDQDCLIQPPIPQIVYVHQGERDVQAVQKLKALEKACTDQQVSQQQLIVDFIEIAPMLAQPYVSYYVKNNVASHPGLKEILLLILKRCFLYRAEEVTSVAFAAIIFGGSCWNGLPTMLGLIDPSTTEEVIGLLEGLLVPQFGQGLANWICLNWAILEEQTLPLLRYLNEPEVRAEGHNEVELATISTAVNILMKVPDFVSVTKGYNATVKWVLKSIQLRPPELKMSYSTYENLIDEFAIGANYRIIQENEEELLELPLNAWPVKIQALQKVALIVDASSAQARIDFLGVKYGALVGTYKESLLTSTDKRYERIFHANEATRPNNLQFGNAQYAALKLGRFGKQLWQISFGQGKSRTMNAMTLILLLTNSTTNIHLVYSNQDLMERDKEDFSNWWNLALVTERVFYHVSLSFKCVPGEVVIIDEADIMFLSDPQGFMDMTKSLKVICLTATPDNADKKGLQKEVTDVLGFKLFEGSPDAKALAVPTVEELPLKADNFDALVSYLKESIGQSAVLAKCSAALMDHLVTQQIPHTFMQEGKVNAKFLRELDTKTNEGLYPLIVVTNSFGMRGFDYRATNNGIKLAIFESFSNQTEAMQGLWRVGRRDDPCSRVILADIPLVDAAQEKKQEVLLCQFLARHQQKNQVTASLLGAAKAQTSQKSPRKAQPKQSPRKPPGYQPSNVASRQVNLGADQKKSVQQGIGAFLTKK